MGNKIITKLVEFTSVFFIILFVLSFSLASFIKWKKGVEKWKKNFSLVSLIEQEKRWLENGRKVKIENERFKEVHKAIEKNKS